MIDPVHLEMLAYAKEIGGEFYCNDPNCRVRV